MYVYASLLDIELKKPFFLKLLQNWLVFFCYHRHQSLIEMKSLVTSLLFALDKQKGWNECAGKEFDPAEKGRNGFGNGSFFAGDNFDKKQLTLINFWQIYIF